MSHLVHYFKDSAAEYDKADRSCRWPPAAPSTPAAAGTRGPTGASTSPSCLTLYFTRCHPAHRLGPGPPTTDRQAATPIWSGPGWIWTEALFARTTDPRHVRAAPSTARRPPGRRPSARPDQRGLSTRRSTSARAAGWPSPAGPSSAIVSGDYSPEYLAAARTFRLSARKQRSLLNAARRTSRRLQRAAGRDRVVQGTKKDAIGRPPTRGGEPVRAAGLLARLPRLLARRRRRPPVLPSLRRRPAGGQPATYLDIASAATRAKVLDVVRRSLQFELNVTGECPTRSATRAAGAGQQGHPYSGYFFPHNVTARTDDAWWQGENARLASLASAARWPRLLRQRFLRVPSREFAGLPRTS